MPETIEFEHDDIIDGSYIEEVIAKLDDLLIEINDKHGEWEDNGKIGEEPPLDLDESERELYVNLHTVIILVGDDELKYTSFIAEDYFTEYVETELVPDLVGLDNIPPWIEIDWDATADNVRHDYSSVDIDGTEYLFLAV